MATKKSNNLLPCPFCGNEKLERLFPRHSVVFVFCKTCGYSVNEKLWQSRPIEAELYEKIVQLETDKEQIKELNTEIDKLKSLILIYEAEADYQCYISLKQNKEDENKIKHLKELNLILEQERDNLSHEIQRHKN